MTDHTIVNMTLYGEDKMSIEEIIAHLSKMGEANLAANLVKIRQTFYAEITRLTAENAELRERLKRIEEVWDFLLVMLRGIEKEL